MAFPTETTTRFAGQALDLGLPEESSDLYYKPSTYPKTTDYGEIAMTRGQARQILDRFTQEALKGNITPTAFQEGLFELSRVGQSPDYTRRLIRNATKTPLVMAALENPEIAKEALGTFGGLIQREGFNPNTARKNFGFVKDLLIQAQKDNLIRPNVGLSEIKEEVQLPMYGALMDWTKANLKNPRVQAVLQRAPVGANVESWGKAGLVPLATGFEPQQFGIRGLNRPTSNTQAPRGDAAYAQRFKQQQEELERLLRARGIYQ